MVQYWIKITETLTIIKFKLKIVLVQEHVLPYNWIFLSFLILSYQLKYNFHSILPKEGNNHSCVFFDKKNTWKCLEASAKKTKKTAILIYSVNDSIFSLHTSKISGKKDP